MAREEIHELVVEGIEHLDALAQKIGKRSKAQKLKAREFWMVISAHANQQCYNLQPKAKKK